MLDTNAIEGVELQRDEIVRSTRLHWFHYAVLIGSLLITFVAWYLSLSSVKNKQLTQFEKEANQVVELVAERMQKYEDALWAGTAVMPLLDYKASPEQWKIYSDQLAIDIKYPGINGIGVIRSMPKTMKESHIAEEQAYRPGYRVFPDHEHDEIWPIMFVEPYDANFKAIGLDMAHETNRFAAAKKARDTGLAQVTGPIVLVQDAQKTPGFLFYAPYYSSDELTDVENRRQHFEGLVYAPFIASKLMQGTLDKSSRHTLVRISDAGTPLYNELVDTHPEYDPSPLFTKTKAVSAYGRQWIFDMWTDKSFKSHSNSNQPLIILLGGLFIDSMLLLLFLLLTGANKRALSYADARSAALERNKLELEETNAELENFAYVASHDLKAPLRGIANAAKWIKQDLHPALESNEPLDLDEESKKEICENILLLENRAQRMDRLLTDLLDYSRLGKVEITKARVDCKELIQDIIALSEPKEAFNLTVKGECDSFVSHRTLLELVLRNLVSNAIKHRDRDVVNINIVLQDEPDFVLFTVEDDGPGIDEKYHEKVFELFQTLQSRDEVEGSGMGLSMVKKIVMQNSKSISIGKSSFGRGVAFQFKWMKEQ